MAQVDRHRALTALRRLHASHHAGTAAVGNCGEAGAVAPFQDSDYLILIARICHYIGRIGIMAAETAHQIAERFAVMMRRPVVGFDRADRFQYCGRPDARRAQRYLLKPWRRGQAQRTPEPLRGPLAQPALCVFVGAVALIAPSPEFQAPLIQGESPLYDTLREKACCPTSNIARRRRVKSVAQNGTADRQADAGVVGGESEIWKIRRCAR